MEAAFAKWNTVFALSLFINATKNNVESIAKSN